MYVCTNVCMYKYSDVLMNVSKYYVHMYICKYLFIYEYKCVCVCIFACMISCTYVCMCESMYMCTFLFNSACSCLSMNV